MSFKSNEIGTGGDKNYISNTDFESGVTGYTIYANTTPAATPEVTPGGTPNVNVTFTLNSSTPLRGLNSGRLSKDAVNRQGHGVVADTFTIEPADKNKRMYVSYDFAASSGYVLDDVKTFVRNVTAGTVEEVRGASANGRFTGSFSTDSNTQYQLIWHIAGTNAVAWTLDIDNIKVGSDSLIDAPISNSETKPLDNNFTGGDVIISRVGGVVTLSFDGTITHSSGSTVSTSGGFIPTWARPTAEVRNVTYSDSTGYQAVRITTTGVLQFIYTDNTDTPVSQTTAQSSDTTLSYSIAVDSNMLSTNELMNQAVYVRASGTPGTSFGTGASGTVIFSTKDYDSSGSYDSSTGVFTAPESGKYKISAQVQLNETSGSFDGATEYVYLAVRKNASTIVAYLASLIPAATSNYPTPGGSTTIELAKGDTIDIRLAQTSGSSISLITTSAENYLTIEKIQDLSLYAVDLTPHAPPVGSIVSWVGGYFGNGSNGSFTDVLGNTVAAVNTHLPENWRVCDGSALVDYGSPIFNGTSRFLPNLTDDRFLMGDTAVGAVGGSNTMVDHIHSFSLSMAHTHTMDHTHPISHTHNMDHTHTITMSAYSGGTPVGTNNAASSVSTSAGTDTTNGPSNTNTGTSSSANSGFASNFTTSPASTSTVTGSVGSGSAATATEARPKYLGAFYIMRVK